MPAERTPAPLFREKLSVPRSWHLFTPIFAVLIGGESILSDNYVIGVAVMAGFWVLAELVLFSLGRREISVIDGRLRAGNWRLPVSQVRAVAPLSPKEMRDEQRRRDEDVYHCTAPWIHTSVLLDVDDPEDVPLWLVSTRDPDGLLQALATALNLAGAT
jgi:hypothetical protein